MLDVLQKLLIVPSIRILVLSASWCCLWWCWRRLFLWSRWLLIPNIWNIDDLIIVIPASYGSLIICLRDWVARRKRNRGRQLILRGMYAYFQLQSGLQFYFRIIRGTSWSLRRGSTAHIFLEQRPIQGLFWIRIVRERWGEVGLPPCC